MAFKKINKLYQIKPTFFSNCLLQVLEVSPLYEYKDNKKSDKQIGIKVEVIIIEDKFPEYEMNTNQFEKFHIKEIGEMNVNKYSKGTKGRVLPTKASFYGDGYIKNLSVEGKFQPVVLNKNQGENK